MLPPIRRQHRGTAVRKRSPVALWMLIGSAAYAAAALTGIQTAHQANEMRSLFQRLLENQRILDEHRREYRMLLLEQETFAGYQNVERIARQELGMHYPEEVAKVVKVPP